MSKQSESKEHQGYVSKAVPKTCMNCQNFTSDVKIMENYCKEKFEVDCNFRCTIGHFAVKKMASCNEFKMKVEND